jgi:threonyl-tRNA synthetase
MIHRAPFGSMERFIAVLIEHCAGNFPIWLSPEQIAILPISEKFQEYAETVFTDLQEKDIRGYLDSRDEKIGRKIRDAEVQKVPYMLVVGEKEQAEGKVSVRKKGEGDLGSMTIEEFKTYFKAEIDAVMKVAIGK